VGALTVILHHSDASRHSLCHGPQRQRYVTRHHDALTDIPISQSALVSSHLAIRVHEGTTVTVGFENTVR
jgi:hypothetical protein